MDGLVDALTKLKLQCKSYHDYVDRYIKITSLNDLERFESSISVLEACDKNKLRLPANIKEADELASVLMELSRALQIINSVIIKPQHISHATREKSANSIMQIKTTRNAIITYINIFLTGVKKLDDTYEKLIAQTPETDVFKLVEQHISSSKNDPLANSTGAFNSSGTSSSSGISDSFNNPGASDHAANSSADDANSVGLANIVINRLISCAIRYLYRVNYSKIPMIANWLAMQKERILGASSKVVPDVVHELLSGESTTASTTAAKEDASSIKYGSNIEYNIRGLYDLEYIKKNDIVSRDGCVMNENVIKRFTTMRFLDTPSSASSSGSSVSSSGPVVSSSKTAGYSSHNSSVSPASYSSDILPSDAPARYSKAVARSSSAKSSAKSTNKKLIDDIDAYLGGSDNKEPQGSADISDLPVKYNEIAMKGVGIHDSSILALLHEYNRELKMKMSTDILIRDLTEAKTKEVLAMKSLRTSRDILRCLYDNEKLFSDHLKHVTGLKSANQTEYMISYTLSISETVKAMRTAIDRLSVEHPHFTITDKSDQKINDYIKDVFTESLKILDADRKFDDYDMSFKQWIMESKLISIA